MKRTNPSHVSSLDNEDERIWIEMHGAHQREKLARNATYEPKPGYLRRTSRILKDCLRLAELQQLHFDNPDIAPISFVRRAMLIIWPHLVDKRDLYPRKRTRRAGRRHRERAQVYIIYLLMMGMNQGASTPGIFEVPKLTLRKRSKREIFPSDLEQTRRWEADEKREIIGRAVLMEYRQHGHVSIDSAWEEVVKISGSLGLGRLKLNTVKTRYHEYRRASFRRGWADERAYYAEIDCAPWPDDQVWLSDFPISD